MYPHIDIVSTSHGARLQQYRDAIKLIITEGPLILAKMAKMVDDEEDPDDYSHLESQFGLEGGKGLAAKGELTAVVEALQADPDSDAATAGNAAKLATKLKQFCDLVG